MVLGSLRHICCKLSGKPMATRSISIRLPEQMAAELAAIARTQGTPVSEVIREAVENHILSPHRQGLPATAQEAAGGRPRALAAIDEIAGSPPTQEVKGESGADSCHPNKDRPPVHLTVLGDAASRNRGSHVRHLHWRSPPRGSPLLPLRRGDPCFLCALPDHLRVLHGRHFRDLHCLSPPS